MISFFKKSSNYFFAVEHGPKGGDEINVNFQKNDQTPNYGWDIASYGTTYSNKDIYKTSMLP